MDLRDQFAIAAMQGLLADGWMADQSNDGWMADQSNIAELAYRQADAMIAEREKDDVEDKDQIKQMLVEAIKEKHPDIKTTKFLPARDLIFHLSTGLPF